jgi:hypothetical protein
MKDTEWDTQSCVFTWATQGLWDPADESTYYHAVNKSSKNALMAAGTNKGQIRIYNYPCLSKNVCHFYFILFFFFHIFCIFHGPTFLPSFSYIDTSNCTQRTWNQYHKCCIYTR